MGKVTNYQLLGDELHAYIKFSKGIKSAIELAKETNVSRAHISRLWNEGIRKKKK